MINFLIMDSIIQRELKEIEKTREFYNFHYYVLKIVERHGYSFALKILKANIATIESLADDSSKFKGL